MKASAACCGTGYKRSTPTTFQRCRCFSEPTFVLPPWLEGVIATGHQYPSTLWVEDWSVAE